MHVFYYLHHLFFYIFKDECIFFDSNANEPSRERIDSLETADLSLSN